MGVQHLHARHLGLEIRGRGAPVALEGELDVLRRHDVAVVELDALAKDELVAEPVLGRAPRLGEGGRHGIARHGLDEGVVERIEHHERRDDARRLGRLEPGRRQRGVNAPGQLAGRRRGGRRLSRRLRGRGNRHGDHKGNGTRSGASHELSSAALRQGRGTLAGCEVARLSPNPSSCQWGRRRPRAIAARDSVC